VIGRAKGGINTKLRAVTDDEGRPIRFLITAGQVRDDAGAAALLGHLPMADWLLAPAYGLKANRCRATDRG
jgi:transposase